MMRGYVELCKNGRIKGWLFDDKHGHNSLRVGVIVDNQKVVEGIASIFRHDLIEDGVLPGSVGFSFPFIVNHHANKECIVQVIETESGWILPPGPFTFRPDESQDEDAETQVLANVICSNNIEGAVDTLTPWGVSGWARPVAGPYAAVRVEVLINGVVIAAGFARELRSDLEDRGGKSNRCGFLLHFKSLLPANVAVVVQATGEDGVAVLFWGKPGGIDGYVDTVAKWGASGWAWEPLHQNTPLTVEARLGNQVIGSSLADEYRSDIEASGRGKGRSGFTLKFDPPLAKGDVPAFFAVGTRGSTSRLGAAARIDLDNPADQRRLHHSPSAEKASVTTPSLDIEGGVDVITRWFASGWVWRPSSPSQTLQVEAVLNGEVIGRVNADQLRPDLLEFNKGNGHYGFALSFARPLEGKTPPLLRVIGPEGPEVIPNFADVSLDAKAEVAAPNAPLFPEIEGHVDYMTRRDAVGWAWFPSASDMTAQIEAVLDGKVIGRALADELRPDLAQHGKGTGLYGFKMKFDEVVTGTTVPEFRAVPAVGRVLGNSNRLPPVSKDDLIKRSTGSFSVLLEEHGAFTMKGPAFEDVDDTILTRVVETGTDQRKPMLIAFYLPQFHAIEENDHFWGKGFTEWRQLPKGMPRFPGHYQPRIPRDLGFYNLENLEDFRKQVAMAKAGGVHGFAYYYYWFNRKRVLERPLDMLLNSDVDMPFMLIWANENWTRTWDGSESQILLEQDYRPEDDDALVDDVGRHLRDRRYIRLNGRPLFVIYNPKNIPDSAKTIARWRKKLTARMGVDPLIFMAQTFGEEDPHPHGLDGAIEFPPHKLSNHLPGRPTPDAYSAEFAGRVIAYDDLVKASLDEDEPEDYPLIKTIVPSWDNDCRRPNRGLTLEGIGPQKYQNWLTELLNRAMDTPVSGAPVVAINAWNEWAESAYLEPDVYFGGAFLNATARAYVSAVNGRARRGTDAVAAFGARPGISVILPNYNHATFLPERIRSVLDQTVPPDEIIFLDDGSSDNSIDIARDLLKTGQIPYRIVVNKKNSGGVFRQWIKGLSLARHDLIWVAETDDSADRRFLSNILPAFARDDVMAAFGRIICVDPEGAPRSDLDGYFDRMEAFSWGSSCVVPAFKAFSHDFAIRNVIPNASGLVFRKPLLNEEEKRRLFQYRFAGDWYFYALVLRGGALAYSRRGRSFFRVNPASASRSAFFTDRHLAEHMMVIEDLRVQYGVGDAAIAAHSDMLAQYLPDRNPEQLRHGFLARARDSVAPPVLRVCIAANGFAVGGGEILPVDLANTLKADGLHITYLVVERPRDAQGNSVRKRLRADIPVVYWDDVCDDFKGFLNAYGIQLINSHNVSLDYRIFLRNLDLGIPYVASLHGGFETVKDLLTGDFLAFLSRAISKWLYLSEKNIAFLSESVRGPHKLLHSFNAVAPYDGEWIDRRAFRSAHAIADDAFVFVQCSRAIESKGWRTSIAIVQSLAARIERSVHLVLIGDGLVAADLMAEYKGSPVVTFLGQIDRPIRYFRCFDMGLFPSTFAGETFPLFLLECFQAGIPVASTDIGEIPRMMRGDGTRTPGPIIDHTLEQSRLTSAFADGLERMFSTAGAYRSYCAEASATSERFSIVQLGGLYTDVFARLVGSEALTRNDAMALRT